jgi:serine/threonine protein kinase
VIKQKLVFMRGTVISLLLASFLAMLKNKISSTEDTVFVEHHPGTTVRRLRTFPAEKLAEILHALETAEENPHIEILKSTPTTTVYKVPSESDEGESLCVKQYSYTSFLSRIKTLFTSRPRRAWAASCYLRKRSIPVIEVVAFRRNGNLPKTEHLFVTYYEHILTLHEYSRRIIAEALPYAQQRAVSYALARALAIMHRHKVYHNDLKGQNVLINGYQTTAPRCIFCDLDSILLWRRLSLRRIAKNLAQLNTSLPDQISALTRMRFFVFYTRLMKEAGITLPQRKLFHRTIALSKMREARRLRRQQARQATG